MHVHVRGSFVVEEGQLAMYCMLASKEMVLPLTALSTEKLNAPSLYILNIYTCTLKLRNACKLYLFSSILERCLDEEQTFNISVAVIIRAYTSHAGISFEDGNTSLMFLQGETPDPSEICSGNRYH